MLKTHHPEEKGIQMASAPIPKHGFSSPGCDGRRLPKHCFRRAARPQRDVTAIGRVSFFRGHPFLASAVGLCCLISKPIRAVESNLTFVVHGVVTHEQFGPNPLQKNYSFVARSHGSRWAISCLEEPRSAFNEILAVGNEEGVFITLEFNPNTPSKTMDGRDLVGRRTVNTSQAIVFKSQVPGTAFAEAIGPIWITYLSGHYFQTVRTNMLPAPTELNVAGGCILPPFHPFHLRSFWELDGVSRLPMLFHAMDDGWIRRMRRGELETVGRYPPPYENGFTNIIFKVTERQTFLGHQLPRKAALDVFWVYNSKLEKVHRFIVEARRFEEAPDTPIPEPSTRGIAVVADERATTSNIPIRVEYVATNRFLSEQEIARLPQSAYVIRSALKGGAMASRPTSSGRIVIIGIFFLFTSVVAATLLLSSRSKTKHN